MSTPNRRISESKPIPTTIRQVYINDPSDLPTDYSSTPGGSLYSTTPGGTRLVYNKSALMYLRNSPTSLTPPNCTLPESISRLPKNQNNNNNKNNNNTDRSQRHYNGHHGVDDDFQFEMEL